MTEQLNMENFNIVSDIIGGFTTKIVVFKLKSEHTLILCGHFKYKVFQVLDWFDFLNEAIRNLVEIIQLVLWLFDTIANKFDLEVCQN